MRKAAAVILIGFGVLATASAAIVVPEVDAASGVNAIALLAGAVLIVRGRRRK